MLKFTEQDFDTVKFEDCLLRGVAIHADFETGSDLVLDIDYLCRRTPDLKLGEFFVAAADLTFHGLTGLKLSIDWQDPTYQCCRDGQSIAGLTRKPVVPQLVFLDRPYWRWSFSFSPNDAQFSFGAYGFTLQLRQEPMRHDKQSLPLALRG
ncbi:MAG: hypothetical protein K8U03_01655 [Planctomycetia bacterium]|nr:hypothetical protein [Planctomycetia bacterium]